MHESAWKNRDSALETAQQCLGLPGSQIQGQKLGVSSQGLIWRSFGVAQEFCSNPGLSLLYLSLAFPGAPPSSKCAKSEFWEAWTRPQLDFCSFWDGGIPNFSCLAWEQTFLWNFINNYQQFFRMFEVWDSPRWNSGVVFLED